MDVAPEKLRDHRPRIWLMVAVIVAASAALTALAFDWNWFKSPIERRVSALTGRAFVIHGDLDVKLGSPVTVRADRVAFANAPWAADRPMARAERIRIDVAPWPLLRGRWRLVRIELERPDVDLIRNARGEPNWRFWKARRQRAPSRIDLGELRVRDGVLRLREPRLKTELLLRVESGPRGPEELAAPLIVRGTGWYRGRPFALDGRVDSPLQLFKRSRAYRVDMHARAGDTRARVHGPLTVPLDPASFELTAEVSGQDLADLYPLLGIAIPESPPYKLAGRLGRDGAMIRYRNLRGTIGDSDVSGDVSLVTGRKRPYARADLVSRHLDIDDLAGLIGVPPSTAEGETANAEQRDEARRRAAAPRVLPDRPYNLAKLRSLDADVRLRAGDIDSGKLRVDSINVHFTLDDGLLSVRPLDVGIAGGRVSGSIRLDARQNPIATTANLRARGLDLPGLLPKAKANTVGRIGGAARVKGRGNSVARMLATADGEVDAVMGSGRVSNLLLELAGLDIAESVAFLVGKDRTVPVRCAYAGFAVDDGVMRARSLAFDTTDTVIFGNGTVDLRQEELDLELKARPKDRSPLALRVPLEVAGTFKDPTFRPQAGPLAARTAAAAALYAIAPPAALLALIETGPGDDVACGGDARNTPPDEAGQNAPSDSNSPSKPASDAPPERPRHKPPV